MRAAYSPARLLLPALLAVLLGGARPDARAEAPREYQIKAAFLYNFTKYVEWPEVRFRSLTAPIEIVVLGRNPFGDELKKLVEGRQASGRPLTVRPAATLEEIRSAHLLFVPEGEETRYAELASALADAGVLTVGESDRFAAAGGVITFHREADKVRFAINLDAPGASRFKLSAQLLKLATSTRRRP